MLLRQLWAIEAVPWPFGHIYLGRNIVVVVVVVVLFLKSREYIGVRSDGGNTVPGDRVTICVDACHSGEGRYCGSQFGTWSSGQER